MRETMLGIDVGATSIKGAIVDTTTGELVSDKIKYSTPHSATPKKVRKIVKKIIKDFKWKQKKFGIGIPAIIKSGVSHSASNIDDRWIRFDAKFYFEKKLDSKVIIINDADAAGIAEMNFGKGRGKSGTVLMLTLGTGIGSGLFIDGNLVPNTELGHLRYKDGIAEHYASNRARLRNKWDWHEWGKELNEVLNYINLIISADTMIIGGGVSKYYSEYKSYLSVDTNLVSAKLLNNAGIIGAAILAYQKL